MSCNLDKVVALFNSTNVLYGIFLQMYPNVQSVLSSPISQYLQERGISADYISEQYNEMTSSMKNIISQFSQTRSSNSIYACSNLETEVLDLHMYVLVYLFPYDNLVDFYFSVVVSDIAGVQESQIQENSQMIGTCAPGFMYSNGECVFTNQEYPTPVFTPIEQPVYATEGDIVMGGTERNYSFEQMTGMGDPQHLSSLIPGGGSIVVSNTGFGSAKLNRQAAKAKRKGKNINIISNIK